MPQSWRTEASYHSDSMDESARIGRDLMIHEFGNLTLLTQPLNSSVSNGPFLDRVNAAGQKVDGKRSKLGQSALLMNTYFNRQGLDAWDEAAIRTRAGALHDAAALVWARPVATTATPDGVASKLSGSDAKQVDGAAQAAGIT
jgi:hypothetical protein